MCLHAFLHTGCDSAVQLSNTHSDVNPYVHMWVRKQSSVRGYRTAIKRTISFPLCWSSTNGSYKCPGGNSLNLVCRWDCMTAVRPFIESEDNTSCAFWHESICLFKQTNKQTYRQQNKSILKMPHAVQNNRLSFFGYSDFNLLSSLVLSECRTPCFTFAI